MRYLIAIIFPPLAVLLCGKPVQFIVNLAVFATILILSFGTLFLVSWIVCGAHALLVVSSNSADRRTNKIIKAMQK